MLWSIFKFFFNVARTLSLLFVLALFAFLFYLSIHPETDDKMEALIECAKERELGIESCNIDRHTSYENEMEEEENVSLFATEIPLQKHSKKIRIPLKNGVAFLRPTQIMYAYSLNGELILQKNEGDSILINMKKSDFDHLILSYAPDLFFKTRSSTFNLNHVDGLIPVPNNPNRKGVVMSDEEIFSVSNDKIKLLEAAMESVQVSPNILDNSNY